MKIEKLLLLSTVVCSSLTFASNLPKVSDELTGDTKLSCEAILCLSTSTKPSECSPSIKRYFSISHKHWEDTIKARKDFLNLCPIQKERAEDAKLEQLINLLVENPDACEINSLNRRYPACGKTSNSSGISECKEMSLPSACLALVKHEYTDIAMPKWKCNQTMTRGEIAYRNAIIDAQKDESTSVSASRLRTLKRIGLEGYVKQLQGQQNKAQIFKGSRKNTNDLINYDEEVCVDASWVLENK